MTKKESSKATIRDAIALLVLGREDALNGRTVLQKQLYFYSVLATDDFGYSAHYYGPYSAEVAAALDSLTSSGWIEDERVPYGIANSFGPVVRHDISASDELRKYESNFSGKKYDSARKIMALVESHPAADNSKQISLAAKLHFIHTDTGEKGLGDLERLATKYGWDMAEFSADDRKQVVSYLKHLGLLRKSK